MAVKVLLLRLFGANISSSIIIKPNVKIKYPWKLRIGEHTWVGEGVWIDNIADVEIGANCCVSQGVYICTGNHDFNDPAFTLVARKVTAGDGTWVCAKAILGPGITIGSNCMVPLGAVVTEDMPDGTKATLPKMYTDRTREDLNA